MSVGLEVCFYRIDRRCRMEETALVTGASGGIGAGIATVLAKQVRLMICVSQSLRSLQGVTVILVARRLELLEQVANRINETGGKALVKAVDVTDKEQVKVMGRWMREEVGLPTILVNNAGTGDVAEFASQTPDDWEPMIDLNIKAGLFCISEFLADMKEAKKGHIVNISSINEKAGRPGMAVYGGTKLFWEGEISNFGL